MISSRLLNRLYRNITEIVVFTLLATSTSAAQTALTPQLNSPITSPLAVYLPVHSGQFPNLAGELKRIFSKHAIGIDLHFADYWSGYLQPLKTGKPGLYFAAPHFVAWASQHHNFTPILRLSPSLRYVLASRRSDSSIFEVNDLVQKRVCAQQSLNLDHLMISEIFRENILSPDIHHLSSVKDEMRNKQSKCAAFAVSEHHFIDLESQHSGQFIRLHQSDTFNNYAFIVSPQIGNHQRLKQLLNKEETRKTLREMFLQTSPNTALISASNSDYPHNYTRQLARYWKLNTKPRP